LTVGVIVENQGSYKTFSVSVNKGKQIGNFLLLPNTPFTSGFAQDLFLMNRIYTKAKVRKPATRERSVFPKEER